MPLLGHASRSGQHEGKQQERTEREAGRWIHKSAELMQQYCRCNLIVLAIKIETKSDPLAKSWMTEQIPKPGLTGECAYTTPSQASKPFTPQEFRRPQRNPFQNSSLRFSNLSRCFHAGLLADFAAEPERACPEAGGGWREQAEQLGRG
jgi:hypothetical protein